MEFAVVRTWLIFSRGMPAMSVSMSSSESMATPTRPTSPAARGSSESRPSCVGRSSATEKPVTPASSSARKRALDSAGVPKPAYWPMIQCCGSAEIPRVYGNSPGFSVIRSSSAGAGFFGDLPRGADREGVHSPDLLGLLVRREPLPAPGGDLLRGDGPTSVDGVERDDALAPLGILHADHRHLMDARHLGDNVLHLTGVDVVSARNDHVALAIHQPQPTRGVEPAQVAGVQPSVAYRLHEVVAPLGPPVTGHDVVAPGDDLADLARRHRRPGVVEDCELHPEGGAAGAGQQVGSVCQSGRVVGRVQQGDRRDRLDQTVVLDEVRREPLIRLSDLVRRHRRPGVAQHLESTQPVGVHIGQSEQAGDHRRNQGRVRHAPFRDSLDDLTGVERRQDQLPAAVHQERQQEQATGMSDGSRVEIGVVGAGCVADHIGDHVDETGEPDPVGTLHSLGPAGRAGRVVE